MADFDSRMKLSIASARWVVAKTQEAVEASKELVKASRASSRRVAGARHM